MTGTPMSYCGCPEPVVVVAGVAPAARVGGQPHGLQPHPCASFHLCDVFVRAGIGEDRHADEPLRVHGAVLFREVVVEAPDDGEKGLPVPDGPVPDPEREQDFRIEAVLIHLAQPLLGPARPRRVVIEDTGGVEPFGRPSGVPARTAVRKGLALVDDGIAPVRQLDAARRAVAVLGGDPVRPHLRWRLEVSVRRDEPIGPGHASPLSRVPPTLMEVRLPCQARTSARPEAPRGGYEHACTGWIGWRGPRHSRTGGNPGCAGSARSGAGWGVPGVGASLVGALSVVPAEAGTSPGCRGASRGRHACPSPSGEEGAR